MKKLGEIALGIVTGIGGFLEAGSIATASQAGSEFGFQLAWVMLLGTASLACLMEMTGRLAAVSHRSYADLMRERFGVRFFLLPLVALLLVSFLSLAAEVGGVAITLEMATGISLRWWAIPVALLGWALLWRGTFGLMEKGTAIFGLVALVFAVGAFKLHPHWPDVAKALLPSTPSHDRARYWYIAVSVLGASISPYLYVFYSAGAIEGGWTVDDLGVNRMTVSLGNIFGGALAICVVVVAAMVLAPGHVKVDSFEPISRMLVTPLGEAGFVLFAATLFVTCFGTTLEIALAMAYLLAEGFGWAWSQNLRPSKDARFSMTYTVAILAAAVPIVLGMNPFALTNIAMVLTAASLPVTVLPLIVLMNDRRILYRDTNGWMSNAALVIISVMAIALFVAAIPLQVTGGG
ncbi:MAG: divalent metal cation transporter [Gemmatimonadaceae bacterium]